MTANTAPAVRSSGQPVLRFAPSPNGKLHLGHALSAITGFEMAQRLKARYLLRIEDIDLARTRPEFIDGILRDLAWLGLHADVGEDELRTGGPCAYRQSDCSARYEAALVLYRQVGHLLGEGNCRFRIAR